LTAASSFAQPGSFTSGQVVTIKRNTPVYKLASGKSKPLADVETGTMLLLVDVSPRKTWLFVQDEDGNRGWVPAKFTDFRVDVEEKAPEAAKETPEEAEDDRDERESREERSLGSARANVLETGVRKSFSDPNGDWAWMAKYTRYPWTVSGLDIGVLAGYDGYLGGKRGGYSVPLRLKARHAAPGRGTAMIVDAGVLLMKDPDPAVAWKTSVSLGLASSIVYSSGFTYGLRLGFDFMPGTRFGLEWDLGWTF
jgi:hypothetical protein